MEDMNINKKNMQDNKLPESVIYVILYSALLSFLVFENIMFSSHLTMLGLLYANTHFAYKFRVEGNRSLFAFFTILSVGAVPIWIFLASSIL